MIRGSCLQAIAARGAIFGGGQTDGLPELPRERALIGVAAIQRDGGNGIVRFAQALHGGFHAGFLDELAGGELKQFADALLELIGGQAGLGGEVFDAQSFTEILLDVLHSSGDGRVICPAFAARLQIF